MADRLSPELADLQQLLNAAPVPARQEEPQPYRRAERAAEPAVLRSIPLGLLAIAFGAVGWVLGAHYSVDGWVLALNLIGDTISVGGRVPDPTGVLRIALIVSLGLVYSIAEVKGRPITNVRWQVWAVSALGVALVHITDGGSTFLALMNPAANAWPISRWLAAQPFAAAVWALLLTYLPEALMILGYTLITGVRRINRR